MQELQEKSIILMSRINYAQTSILFTMTSILLGYQITTFFIQIPHAKGHAFYIYQFG
jgi:uncharacterized membrane protein YwzB